ncbi:MAG: cyclic-phosphate processing receiver domain-containing protein [Acidobacteriota bacterium]
MTEAATRTRAVLLEDDERRLVTMRALLTEHWPELELIHFDNAPQFIDWLPGGVASARVILLDHDLGPSRPLPSGERFEPGDGRDVTRVLAQLQPGCPVMIHSTNGLAVPTMIEHLEGAGWITRRVVPYDDLEWIEETWLPRLSALLRESG